MGTRKTDTNLDLYEPERRYRDLYDNAPIAYFTVNAANGRIVNCNKAAQRLLDYSRKVMLQMTVFELYADTLHGMPKAQKVFKDFKAGKSIRNIELQAKQSSGHLIWVSLSVEPELDPDGKTIRSRSIMVDISDRKEAEIALQKIYNNVQKMVDDRTAELADVNAQLKQEIEERKKVENTICENAKTLHTLLNATTNLVMLLNVDGTLVTANEQACERYGKTLEEFKGLNVFALMPPKLAESRKKLADAVIQSKHPVCCFEEIDGMFFNSIIYPILDDSGVVRKYSVFVQDVTALKLTENELKKSEKNFKTLAENANDGITLVEGHGNIVYVNRWFEEMSGYGAHELLKCGMNKLIDANEREVHVEKLRECLEGKPAPNRYETKLITKSGHALPVDVTASKTIWHEQPVCMMIVRDITSQKQLEAELISEQIKLEHRVKERTKELVETNNALSVLARNIDQKRERFQEKTTRTINSKILPIIEKFHKNKAFAKHRPEFDVLKAYLHELGADTKDEPGIIFILSNAELRIATMVKNGFSSPEIARLLSVSQDTVKTHRKNIRRKLNISNSKINLTTYLRAKLG